MLLLLLLRVFEALAVHGCEAAHNVKGEGRRRAWYLRRSCPLQQAEAEERIDPLRVGCRVLWLLRGIVQLVEDGDQRVRAVGKVGLRSHGGIRAEGKRE